MGLFDRFRRKPRPGVLRTASTQDTSHLEQWTKSRQGVEAYVEPKTTVTETTVVLVAHDGEWTRRRVASPDAARSFARKLGMPIYDAGIVGYPKRMRDYTARKKASGDL
ncbi:oxidoreductase [Lentzea sp. NEAU-D13]|uniref:Oxidoreductase n=1 Tax=Lentzea alba TaxID=2714351 RepID=A0A7C9RVI1_9PSEU|nr:oxidoreductase [Lentzea alba]NGY62843.1 oxidoreductase [Lentzea alba]